MRNHYSEEGVIPGANACNNGRIYEDNCYHVMWKKIQLNYNLKNTIYDYTRGIYKYCNILEKNTNKLVAIFSCQGEFNTEFLRSRHIQSNKLGFEKEPDGCFYYPDTNKYHILELKNQNGQGSVDEKLRGGPSIRRFYSKTIGVSKDNIQIVYGLSDNFKRIMNENKLNDILDEMDENDISHHFGYDIPLSYFGLHEDVTLSEDEIQEIVNKHEHVKKQGAYFNSDDESFVPPLF